MNKRIYSARNRKKKKNSEISTSRGIASSLPRIIPNGIMLKRCNAVEVTRPDTIYSVRACHCFEKELARCRINRKWLASIKHARYKVSRTVWNCVRSCKSFQDYTKLRKTIIRVCKTMARLNEIMCWKRDWCKFKWDYTGLNEAVCKTKQGYV